MKKLYVIETGEGDWELEPVRPATDTEVKSAWGRIVSAKRKPGQMGGAKPKLSAEQVAEIRRRRKESAEKLAQEYGVGRTTIYRAWEGLR